MSALSEQDANAQISPSKTQSSLDEKSKTVQKDLIKKVSATNNTSGTYISPSDAIMSPASQKLASFKQKQIDRQNDTARRSLFVRTLSSNSEKSGRSFDGWK